MNPLFTAGSLLTVVLLLSAGCASGPEANFKPDPGFISLTNGKDLTGWRYKPDETFDGRTESSDGRYTARDGMIVVNDYDAARGPHLRQLWTTAEFSGNFILTLEFRAAVNADSGIFIREPQLQ